MKYKNEKSVNHVFHTVIMLPTALFSIGLAIPVSVAHASIATPDEIIVTARRTEEILQNVPISMTVFNQDMLTERNVTTGADLATYTPSLAVNTRFGSDQTTFAIRGFTQELRTTASVAVYFADVVAPRGGGSITAGDGAGPGAFFDLQNVQVLKGPQGTLFGRNTTGGAIQLVPQEPTNKFEGYLEQSAGNYNMRRTQAVLNVPITDDIRARFGVDTQKRDGYQVNTYDVGPARFSDVDYVATRASVLWNITDAVTNYTIFTNTYSKNNGSVESLFACDPAGSVASACTAVLTAQGNKFYNVTNSAAVPNPVSELKQWQAINTTTWNISDDFSIKNNLAYAHLKTNNRSAFFGINLNFGGHAYAFFPAGSWPGVPQNSQNTLVEELQFSGAALKSALTWQGGLYFEHSTPDGISGSLSAALVDCNWPLGGNTSTWNCAGALDGAGMNSNLGTVEYTNKAAYAQSSYDISDEFRVTIGARYTIDNAEGESRNKYYSFANDGSANAPVCVFSAADSNDNCKLKTSKRSEAPTWLIDFDYLPNPDILVYTKYARGYRQGSVNIFAPEGLQVFNPEKVDAYEIGAKTTFRAPIPGTFNVSAFYNELSNQQLQANYVPCTLNPVACSGGGGVSSAPGSPTTAILNAGSSTIQGVDVETTLKLLDSLVFNLSYTYLETRLNSLTTAPDAAGYSASPTADVGGHLSFSPTHSVTTGLNYQLPVPADLGDVTAGASYTFISDQISSAPSTTPFGTLPSRRLLNLNMGWKAIAGSAFDAQLFMTNALNEQYSAYVPGVYGTPVSSGFGMEFRVPGEPRMWGARIKYAFGQ